MSVVKFRISSYFARITSIVSYFRKYHSKLQKRFSFFEIKGSLKNAILSFQSLPKIRENCAFSFRSHRSTERYLSFGQVPQQQKTNQVVPEKPQNDQARRREMLKTWRYHCEVDNAVVTDKKSKLTEAAKLLSAEEMRLLEADIFNPLNIAWIITQNSETSTAN